ncbi:hypothetical protein ACI2KR_06705 [Pseudomonas luteola]
MNALTSDSAKALLDLVSAIDSNDSPDFIESVCAARDKLSDDTIGQLEEIEALSESAMALLELISAIDSNNSPDFIESVCTARDNLSEYTIGQLKLFASH